MTSAPGPFPVGAGSLGKAQWGPELALVPAGIKQEPLSVAVCLSCCKTWRKQPFPNNIPATAHPSSSFPSLGAAPEGHRACTRGPSCPWSHPLASPWGQGVQGSSGLGKGHGGYLNWAGEAAACAHACCPPASIKRTRNCPPWAAAGSEGCPCTPGLRP